MPDTNLKVSDWLAGLMMSHWENPLDSPEEFVDIDDDSLDDVIVMAHSKMPKERLLSIKKLTLSRLNVLMDEDINSRYPK